MASPLIITLSYGFLGKENFVHRINQLHEILFDGVGDLYKHSALAVYMHTLLHAS